MAKQAPTIYRVNNWVLLVSLVVLLFLSVIPSFAQLPKLPLLSVDEKKEAAAPAPPPATPAEQRAAIKRQLAEAEAERDRLKLGEKAPPGITSQEIDERRRLRESLATRLQFHLSLLGELEELRMMRADAEKRASAWTGFPEKPPYSILMADKVRDAVSVARIKTSTLENSLVMLERELPRYNDSAKQAEAQSRREADKVERAPSPEVRAAAEWRKDLARLRTQSALEFVALGVMRGDVLREKIGIGMAELGLLERQLAEARRHALFSQDDLAKVRERLNAAREQLAQEMEKSLARDVQSARDLSSVREELQRTRAAGGSARSIQLLEAKVSAAEASAESSRFETEALNTLLAINQRTLALWEARFEATTGTDTEKRLVARGRLKKMFEQAQPWKASIKGELESSLTAEREQEDLLKTIDPSDPGFPYQREILDARRLRRTMAEQVDSAFDQSLERVRNWLEELETTRTSRSLGQRLSDAAARIGLVVRNIWNFELFAVEDTVEVGGQKVTTSRGVTVGKSVGALLLFLIGYTIAAFIGRRVQRLMVSRFGVGERQANVMRRWLLAFVALVLLVFTLNLARIPVTVFAFLGGALAIGVGFGTQTLIKNLISGIIILVERKMQVGDIVEVDGVTGTVTEVDIRSSTVQGFDGVETMIPNSTFLENKVTNWTHTNARLRRMVRVGVAYGSPVDTVRDILFECADRHGLVLKDPEPMVLFDDFGDNALMFSLYYWLELGPNVNSLKVASDLRFMIERRFAEGGVIVAYPQRDVHLNTARPLQVEVVASPSPATS